MRNILSQFRLEGAPVSCARYGNGHINETYKVETDAPHAYILQKINRRVFSNVPGLMRNIAAVKGEGVSSSVRMEITENGELLSCTIDGKTIDPHRIYTVATIDYLAEGNDKMYALKKAVKRHDIGFLARDVMMEYVLKHRVIDSKIEGRIVVK